ncbi:MAG: leucine-rich repeat domain-containing protein [Clostridia bacterium]|nr:leucine-rich repeat domain-containing protein [Clostridia bacterium]
MKKFCCVIVCILLLLGALPLTVFAEEDDNKCGANLTWSYNAATKTLNISGTGAMDDYHGRLSPWNSLRREMKILQVENGCTYIGESAFRDCTGLTDISLPQSVTAFGAYAFWNCDFESFTIPAGVTVLSKGMFGGCWNLTELTVPSGVTTIGESALNGCTRLRKIYLPQSLTTIGSKAFWLCDMIENLIISNSVTNIATDAFTDYYGAIYGAKGSTIERHATVRGLHFFVLPTAVDVARLQRNLLSGTAVLPTDDYNVDEVCDVCDLVRAKKLIAG